jgi:hypothetical protein
MLWFPLLLAGAAVCAAVGLRRARIGLLASEQIAGGLLVGWMVATWLVYLTARVEGGLRGHAVAGWAVVFVALGAAAVLREGAALDRARALLARERALLLLLAVALPVLTSFFWTRMLIPRDGAIWSGGSAWGDMALHAALASSFTWTDNVPPTNILFPPGPLEYPFLPDFLTAMGMVSGVSMHAALVLTGATLAATAVTLFFCLTRRVTGSPNAGLVASALLWLNGGFGFLYFLDEWRESGRPLSHALAHLREDYCHVSDLNLYWSNLVTDVLLPQRAALFGLPAGFFAFLLFALAWTRGADGERRRQLLAAGLLVGLLPRFHTHTFVAVGLVSGFLFLLRPRRDWVWFWVPAVAIAAPQMVHVGTHAAASSFVHLKPGWLANGEPQVLFWIRNIGPVLLLAIPAWRAAARPWRRFYLAFVALQALASVVMLTPNDWDNIKLMYAWYALTCALVGAWLARLATRQAVLAASLALCATASGILALQHERTSSHEMFTADEVRASEWARAHSGGGDVFAAAPSHLQPVASLAGRPLVLGYTGWMWTHGYDYQPRFDDLVKIYGGAPEADALLRRYDVRYIYFGPRERADLKANEAFLSRFPVVYHGGSIAVLDARAAGVDVF